MEGGRGPHLRDPVADGEERLPVRHVVDQQDALGCERGSKEGEEREGGRKEGEGGGENSERVGWEKYLSEEEKKGK